MSGGRWATSVAAFRDALSIGVLRRVLAGWLLFNAAEWAIWVAILVYAYQATGPASVGIVAVAQLVPAAIAAPVAARLAERLPTGRALAAIYGLLGLLMLATGAAMVLGLAPVVVVALAASVVMTYTSVRPTQTTLLPGLVGRAEQLTAANSLTTILEGVGVLIGPLSCGLIVAIAEPATVYLAGGVATLAAAMLVRPAPISRGAASVDAASADAAAVDAVAAGFAQMTGDPPSVASTDHQAPRRSGIAAVRAAPARLLSVGLLATRFGAAAAMDVLLVLAAIELLGMGEAGAGYLSAAIGFGWVLGGASTMVVVGRPRLTWLTVVGAVVWALPIIGLALLVEPVAALTLLVVGGVGLALVDVAVRTVLQRLVPTDELAAVFGVAEGASMAGAAGGALAAGLLASAIGIAGAIVVAGVALPAIALLAVTTIGRGEAGVRIPFREIALLRRLPLFAPVPAPALEAAAAALAPARFLAGDVIIREGAVGDRFWVVGAGTLKVSQAGVAIGVLGAGDAFGELALLRDIPRTATVTARTEVELLGLDRDTFLLTLTASPRAVEEAGRVAARHLASDQATRATADDVHRHA